MLFPGSLDTPDSKVVGYFISRQKVVELFQKEWDIFRTNWSRKMDNNHLSFPVKISDLERTHR